MIYQNFDLEIICPQGGKRLCARVLESPQGDCPFIDVKWPFDADTENRLLTDIYGELEQRHGHSTQANALQDFGGRLFEAVFSGDIEHLFRSSLATSMREGKGLRIRLRLPEDSELHMQPWEFLFDTESREFLAVSEHTPLVRYLPVAQAISPITVEGPLRVLVALSSPTDHPRLDLAREWEILCHALEPSISAGQLVLHRVPGHCTFNKLRDSLRHFGAHIFHFVGHGIPGALVLEQESGKGLVMEAAHLRSAFPSGALPRLIVLNACSGAITQGVPFSGLAQGFLKQGVPAVVAMQASITDDAAMIFIRYFYRDLVEIGAVDTSLTEARLRMQGNGHPIEWGTPVLYMRALDGQLFRPAANLVVYPDDNAPPAKPALDPTGPDITAKVPPQQAAPPIAPTLQAEEFTVPLPPESKPAERHIPPAKLEPRIDANKTLWNAQPRPSVPIFTFDPDPELEQQGIPGAGAKPASGAQAPAAGPARAHGTKRVRVVATAGLLATVAGIAIGVKFLPSTGNTPEAPSSRSPITPITSAPSTAASAPAARPDATAASVPIAPVTSSTAMPGIEAAPVASDTLAEDKPDSRVQTKERQGKRRPVAATTSKGQPRKSATAARVDNCKSAVVSERPASCLFKNQ
jgi:hypothetical protein